ncbi:uncharacterized protein LOC120273589 [Dioscorea cayenensis subsp. rotundata]|uniref:Uncharacterized protein LOC120273589 n=1 Tax=Dioscorea cayennensis subsp. rotundata TaxID=55577 RepID=A0AB40C8M4_DIOCR|nr:uncharacterized protein LOC120273589 [Dioscorea cayenensis subsp. rotundata]
MAYRRRQSIPRTFSTIDDADSSSLAARAIRDHDLAHAAAAGAGWADNRHKFRPSPPPDATAFEYASTSTYDEPKNGFWGVLARKAKSILEDNKANDQFESSGMKQPPQMIVTGDQFQSYQSFELPQKRENPSFHKNSDALAASITKFGGTIRNALEEGLTIMEHKTADIIQETRKLQIKRKEGGPDTLAEPIDRLSPQNLPQIKAEQEAQLKASRNVANSMAAKAKLLLRELKTVKADLAFVKQRCNQLEDENKVLRENREKGARHEDDDLIRLQLETLLAEKARLAHENSLYTRENRFLREIVEYHQPEMQDVVYLDEDIDDDTTELCPSKMTSPLSSPAANRRSPSPIITTIPCPGSPGSSSTSTPSPTKSSASAHPPPST